jgi:methyltransferase
MVYYFVLFGLFAVRKVVDQVRSRQNFDALVRRRLLPAEDRAFGWLLATHLAFFLLTPLEIVLLRREFLPALGVPMIVLLLTAIALRHWSTSLLGTYWTSQVAVPQDMQPVICGPYRLIRHPNYLAMSLELLAMDLIYTAYLSALVVGVLNAWAVILRIRSEEYVLFQIPTYRAAMQDKARLIPGVY